MWLDGKQHGRGKYISPKKEIKDGVWQHGKRTHWIMEVNALEIDESN